jgi:hypothetical protein
MTFELTWSICPATIADPSSEATHASWLIIVANRPIAVIVESYSHYRSRNCQFGRLHVYMFGSRVDVRHAVLATRTFECEAAVHAHVHAVKSVGISSPSEKRSSTGTATARRLSLGTAPACRARFSPGLAGVLGQVSGAAPLQPQNARLIRSSQGRGNQVSHVRHLRP